MLILAKKSRTKRPSVIRVNRVPSHSSSCTSLASFLHSSGLPVAWKLRPIIPQISTKIDRSRRTTVAAPVCRLNMKQQLCLLSIAFSEPLSEPSGRSSARSIRSLRRYIYDILVVSLLLRMYYKRYDNQIKKKYFNNTISHF